MKYVGYGTAILAFLVAQFWGVPFYIKTQVDTQVTAKLAEIASIEGTPAEITTLEAEMQGVKEDVSEIKVTTNKLYDLVLADFQRRAEGN